MTRPRGELTTYRARGGYATNWTNPKRSNFLDTVDRGRTRAYVAVRRLPILLKVRFIFVEHGRLSATWYFCRQLVVCSRKHAYVDLELWLIFADFSVAFSK